MKNKRLDGWTYAFVNKRLAEVYFHEGGIFGHCYVNSEKLGKRDRKYVQQDIKHWHFTYRNGMYRNKITGETFKQLKLDLRGELRSFDK
jgi:hypothetical protein